MGRMAMDDFEDGTEIVRVYLAATLAEAESVERALADAGRAYAIELEEFASPTALGSNAPRRGVGFWIPASELDPCADLLERAGLVAGLVQR
jgi:hypothetical protein